MRRIRAVVVIYVLFIQRSVVPAHIFFFIVLCNYGGIQCSCFPASTLKYIVSFPLSWRILDSDWPMDVHYFQVTEYFSSTLCPVVFIFY